MPNSRTNKVSPPRRTEEIPACSDPHADLRDLKTFRREVFAFYGRHKRMFTWREDITPYRIVVSEIMLQQTGVERVKEKFEPFLLKLPGFESLAAAPLRDIMEAWQGLGYNRRALSLKRLSEVVMERHSGKLPRDRESLLALPGVGEATAGAIMAFAFNAPTAFIETNIRRVFIHHFFADRNKVSDRQIMPLVEAALDRSNPRDWYYALMDYGSALGGTAYNPNRKSVHYAKQAPFHDSDRKVRGEMIRLLLGAGSMAIDDIVDATGHDADRLTPVLCALVRDGLITEEAGCYRIA